MDFLYGLDLEALHFVNVDLAYPGMDQFWLCITQLHKQPFVAYVLLPALLMVLLYIYRLRIFKLILAMMITESLSDLICYRLFKHIANRPRPFLNPETADWLRKVGEAHGPSFPSNHAANCFAGAVILSWYFPSLRYIFYSFAALVAISRVALGVHYPGDVMAGALLGIVIGSLVKYKLLKRVPWFRARLDVPKVEDNSGEWRTRSRRLQED